MGNRAVSTEVCLRYSEDGGLPRLLCVLLKDDKGVLVGLCLVNLRPDTILHVANIPMRWVPSCEYQCGIEGQFEYDEKTLVIAPDGTLFDAAGVWVPTDLVLPPLDAAFLVRLDEGVEKLTLTLNISRQDFVLQSADQVVVVCGDSLELGRWDPKQAPKMKAIESAHAKEDQVLQVKVHAKPGESFKYVILNGPDEVIWEDNRPNRILQTMSKDEPMHSFNCIEPFEVTGDSDAPWLSS
jgi:hypothetical protein